MLKKVATYWWYNESIQPWALYKYWAKGIALGRKDPLLPHGHLCMRHTIRMSQQFWYSGHLSNISTHFIFSVDSGLGVPLEVPEEGPIKRHRGWRPSVGHFHKDVPHTHFSEGLMALGNSVLSVPDGFGPYLGPLSGKMIGKTTTRRHWEINIGDVSAKDILEAG
jgi:hypothetical protein